MAGRKVKILSGPRAGTEVDVDDSAASDKEPTNSGRTYTEIVDDAAGTASNAGRQAQSSDNANKYN
jgi:hypothetical protein